MHRAEVGCCVQLDGITMERRALDAALVRQGEIAVNHVVMQICSPVTLEVEGVGGKQLRRFVPGDIHVIPQGSRVSLSAIGASPALVMSFDNQVLERSLAEEDRAGTGFLLALHLGIRDLQLQCLLSVVEAELRSGCRTGPGYLRQLGAALTSYLARRYSTGAKAIVTRSDGLPAQRLRTVLDHIHTHLEESLTVVELAGMVRMSPQHFANLFRQSTGLAPHRYVLRRRIERAEHLLSTTNLSLADITLESGFASQSHFTDVFRKTLGTTPRRYRSRFTGTGPMPAGGTQGVEGPLLVVEIPPETSLKKPSGSLGSSGSGPEQLSIYFDGSDVKCG
jgi:AraC family transcriptional regulator